VAKAQSWPVEDLFFYGHLESSEIEYIKLQECAVITIIIVRACTKFDTMRKLS